MPDSIHTIPPAEAQAIALPADTLAADSAALALQPSPLSPVVSGEESAPETDATALFSLDPDAESVPLAPFATPDDVRLPFFSLSEVEIPEAAGFTGELLPYSFRTDDGVTGALLLCFFLTSWVISHSWVFLRTHLLSFLRPQPGADGDFERTGSETRGVIFLFLQTAFVLSILYYGHLRFHAPAASLPESPYPVLGLTSAILILFVLLKVAVCQLVNHVFFSRAQCGQWAESYVFSIVWFGLLALPVALLVVFLDLDFQVQQILLFCILLLVKMTLFFRYFRTFFPFRAGWLHLILYLCALEITPALTLWRILFWASTNLTEII